LGRRLSPYRFACIQEEFKEAQGLADLLPLCVMAGHDGASTGGGGCNSIMSFSSRQACGGKVTVLLISSLSAKGMAGFAVTPDGI